MRIHQIWPRDLRNVNRIFPQRIFGNKNFCWTPVQLAAPQGPEFQPLEPGEKRRLRPLQA